MTYTKHTKKVKTYLDVAAAAYVTFGTGLPARLGGWRWYLAIALVFVVTVEAVKSTIILVVKSRPSQSQ
jgi:hypothetical protein